MRGLTLRDLPAAAYQIRFPPDSWNSWHKFRARL